MTSADYRAYTKTREYKRFPFKTKLHLAWEEDKKQWREHGWLYRIGFCILFRIFIGIPTVIIFSLLAWLLVATVFVIRIIVELCLHWQTYAISALVIAIILLVHFGVI